MNKQKFFSALAVILSFLCLYLISKATLDPEPLQAEGCGIFNYDSNHLSVYGVDTGDGSARLRVNVGAVDYRWSVVSGSGSVSPAAGNELTTYTTGLPNDKHSDEVWVKAETILPSGQVGADCRTLIFVTRWDPPVCKLTGGWPDSGLGLHPGESTQIRTRIFEDGYRPQGNWQIVSYSWSLNNRYRCYGFPCLYGGAGFGSINPSSGSGTTTYTTPSPATLEGTGFIEAVDDLHIDIVDSRGLKNSCDTYVLVTKEEEPPPSPKPPESCSVSGSDFLFLNQSGTYRGSVGGGDSPFSFSWRLAPDVGSFSNQSGNEIDYRAPNDLPDGGKVTLHLTVSNDGGSAACSKDVQIYEGVIQGRLFNDENENGRKDWGEGFVSSDIGAVSILPDRERQGIPGDGCSGAPQGYRFRRIPPNIGHTVVFRITTPGWRVTRAYYTNGGFSCTSLGSGVVGSKISEVEYQVGGVTVWEESPRTNLWFGVKSVAPPVCSSISANPASLRIGTTSQLTVSASGYGSLTYNWTTDYGTFDDSTRADPIYTAPNTVPPTGQAVINATVSNLGGSASCPAVNIPIFANRAPACNIVTFPDPDGNGLADLASGATGNFEARLEDPDDHEVFDNPVWQADCGGSFANESSNPILVTPQTVSSYTVDWTAPGVVAPVCSVSFSISDDEGATTSCSVPLGVSSRSWLQVVNGDVYSHCSTANCPGAGLSFYVPNSPPPPFSPFFAEARPDTAGSQVIARSGINCDCQPGAELNERRWEINLPEQPWPEVFENIRFSLSVPPNPVSLLYEEPYGGTLEIDNAYVTNNLSLHPVILYVRGSVRIKGEVEQLAAVIIAAGRAPSGEIEVEDSSRQLIINGALYAQEGFIFNGRTLADNSRPGIVINYDPVYAVYPLPAISETRIVWWETASGY